MYVTQLIRESGLFEESCQKNGTMSFFYRRKQVGGSIYVQPNDESLPNIYCDVGRLKRLPHAERLRAYLKAHAYRIGRPKSEHESYYALRGEEQIRDVLRIIRARAEPGGIRRRT